MYAVFYDLETTTKHTVGQILNYSFILVDESLTPIDELSGLIRISRLQLPEPGAILANRTDVLLHQNVATDNEPVAMAKVDAFLSSCIQRAKGAIAFVGYNSSRFDLGFLRTSMIRNGLNPYFKGMLTPRDLLHVVQKAYLTCEDFRERVKHECANEKRLSLSLQTVSHALSLLEGEQAHESRADVLLTIRLAAWLRDRCALDVRTFEAYEGLSLHSTAKSGTVYEVQEPEYDLSETSHIKRIPMCLLDEGKKAGLWINLDRYLESATPQCVVWRQIMKHSFFTSGRAVTAGDVQQIARKALGQFKKVNLFNFFDKSTCDIEQDIYRLDFDAQDVYYRAIRESKKEILSETPHPDAKRLWVRYRLAGSDFNPADPRAVEVLRQYALYRYGGKLQLVRTIRDAKDPENFHPSLAEMMAELKRYRDGATAQGKQEDIKLLDSLEAFYRSSEILKVAGNDLVPGLVGGRAHHFGGSSTSSTAA